MVPFKSGESPKHSRRQEYCQQKIGRTPETATVHKAVGEEYLDAVVERYACREDEKQHRLPFREHHLAFYFLAGDIESQQQHEHRQRKMIGHTDRNHHVGKAEKQQRKQ